jgi:FixJ family two-component response regulator
VRSLGFRTMTFGSAEEFLESTQAKATACLITDVQMPGLNGVELQQRLIADGQNVPTIFISGLIDDRLEQDVLRSGALGYLRKPFNIDRLINYIDAALTS